MSMLRSINSRLQSKDAQGYKKKTEEKGLQRRESNPEPPSCREDASSIAPRRQTLITYDKLIIFKTFAHEILPVDAVWSR